MKKEPNDTGDGGSPMAGAAAAPASPGAGGKSSGATPNNRLIRSFTLFDNRDFLPRTFQIELYEACKFRDTIVFLRPGNGKHFITVMLVKYFSPKSSVLPIGGDSGHFSAAPRKVFFLTKMVNSIRLYASVFRAHTDFRVLEHHEADPELGNALPWTYEEWQNNFLANDIHLMLDLTFERLLQKGYLGAENIQLLILDDVHKIIFEAYQVDEGDAGDSLPNQKDECYTRIMRSLRAKGLQRNSTKYRVLGLSASILIENVSSKVFESMIGRIEQQLDCTCETYADLRMINKYSVPCRINLRYFPPIFVNNLTAMGIELPKLQVSLFKIRNYTVQFFSFLKDLQDTKLSDQVYLVTHESLSTAITDVLFVMSILGEWCAIKLVDLYNREIVDTMSLLKGTKSNYLKLLSSTYTTLLLVKQSILAYLPGHISEKFEAFTKTSPNSDTTASSPKLTLAEFFSLSSPKLHLLAQILQDYLKELRGSSPIQSTFSFPANICGIIYAERRATVRIIAAWIAELVTLTAEAAPSHPFTYLLPDYVFLKDEDRASGTSSIYTQKQQQKSLHEIFYYRRQEEVLKRFRFAHNCNLLVTSSMSAEGLDVNRCNLVLCFDQPNCFQAYIQSKGRVRSENGLFYVLADEFSDREKNYYDLFSQFVEIEKIFTKLVPLMNELRFEAKGGRKTLTFDVASIKPDSSDSPAVAATTASAQSGPPTSTVQLTMENAISILNRYCLKLPSDTFTKLAPHYYIDPVTIPPDGVQLNGSARYQCRLYLPINSTFRDEVKGDPMSNRVMAKRSAAFKAVKILQELGELDANYYPIGKETSRYIEKLGLQDCFITTTAAGARTMAAEGASPASATLATTSSTTTTATTTATGPGHNRPGNRYNRLQARNIASKRRLYYDKKVANYLSAGRPFTEVALGTQKRYRMGALYEFTMALTCPLPDEQNVRGRPLVDPAKTRRNFGIIVPGTLPAICDFTIYNRSGEVTVSLKQIETTSSSLSSRMYSEAEIDALKAFHTFTIEGVLRLGKNQLRATFDGDASNGNFLIVPVNDNSVDGGEQRGIDWDFIQQIVKHVADLEATKATAASEAIPAVINATTTTTEPFVFVADKYRDAVVIPTYRRDKAQAFFYVAQICEQLSPMSTFPDHGFATFEEYYRLKYGLTITNTKQPLLDVDHTSSRLNLLTPRYLNRKGNLDSLLFPASSLITTTSASKKAAEKAAKKGANHLQQKQILVPELCAIHPFPASFWRKAVTLPCMLYRLNSLLVAEELRQTIAREANIGLLDLPAGMRWPALDFGWSRVVQSHCQAVKAKAEAEERKAAAEAKAKLNRPMISFDEEDSASSPSPTVAEYASPTRDDVGVNMAGRPAASALVPGSTKAGSVQLGDYSVDVFQTPPLPTLPEPLKPISLSPPPPPNGSAAAAVPNQVKLSKTSFQPVPDERLDEDPFSGMGDWNSFAAEVSATQPELLKAPTTEIEIISFGSSTDPSTAIPDGFGDTDPELIELRNQAEAKAREKARLAAMGKASSPLDSASYIDEPAIIEVDAEGNPLERPMRIGSPTQFDQRSDDDDDDDEEEKDNEDGTFCNIFAVDTVTDWTVPCDGASVHSDDETTSITAEVGKFTLNLDGLSKDLENLQICEDDDFLAEIRENYGAPNEGGEDSKDNSGDGGQLRLKSAGDEVKEVSDDLDGSYSDFDVDDMDDEDEYFPELAEDLDLEDLDDDEELAFDDGDDDDDDDDDDSFSEGAKTRGKKHKKNRKSNKKKGGNANNAGGDLSAINGEGANAESTAAGSDETSEVKAKSFIYDILRYELLYDCQTFERQSKTPRMFGGDGSQLLNVDRQNRSRNRKIYERIYLAERTEVALAAEKVMQELKMGPFDDGEINISGSWAPEDMVEAVDSRLEDVALAGEDVRFFDVLTCKFDEDSLCPYKVPPDPLEEIEKLNEEDLKEDPRALMADYGLDGTGTDEVKFGELLPNRAAADDDLSGGKKQPQFSFDGSPAASSDPKGPTGGLCLGPDPSLILQAITMSNSSDGINLERLETVGDSFLKYSITAFLFCMCPDLNEGKLSFLRSRQISNINLHRLGQRIQLGQLMIASKFEPNDNWCPPGYRVLEEAENVTTQVDKNKVPYNLLTQHSIPNKSIADCVEALIGTYLISSGSQGAIQFMDWLGLKVMPKEFRALTRFADTVSAFSSNSHDQWLPMPKSPLIVPKEAITTTEEQLRAKLDAIYQQHRLNQFEQAIGYTFKDKAYLVQAFTHNSYYENTVTDCYQRLEFLGDAVLDYLITRYLYEDPRCHSPGTLTDLRSALVNNTFFASLAVKYSFNKYLMELSHELFRVVDGFVKKFNLCNANRLEEEQKAREAAAASAGAENGDEDQVEGEVVEEEDPSKRSCVYWELFISENEAEHLEDIEVPKALGDIFESVAGAIFLDSGMSLDAVWNAYYPMMKPEIEYFSYNVPKSPIRVLLEKQPQSAKFGKPEITSGRKIRVSVEVFNVGKFVGVGRNKRIAKCTAAKRALRALKIIDDHQRKRAEELMGANRAYETQDAFSEEAGFKFSEEPLPR